MKRASTASYIALVGIMAATVECAKLALSFLPNIEAVTLLLALYSYVFGSAGVMAALVFVCIEPLIYGINTWVITYFIYWPLVALVFMLLGRAGVKNRFSLASVAVALTVFFGVLSSFVDLTVLAGSFDNLFQRFAVYYTRGAVFYVVQTVCNAVLFIFLFPSLRGLLEKIKGRTLQ